MNGTEDFFKAMAPVLAANVLTLAFLYAFTMLAKDGEDRGPRLAIVVFGLFATMYGLYLWGVYPASS
jgi:hypothetical protein